MKIKLDENLSRHLKSSLVQRGHEVSTASEEGLLGRLDAEVGAAAKAEERMVLTLDLDETVSGLTDGKDQNVASDLPKLSFSPHLPHVHLR